MSAIALESPLEDPDFDREGHWLAAARPAALPDEVRFRRELEAHLARLPAMQARAYRLRDIEGLAPARICERLGIDEELLAELLHRARLALRRALF